MKARDIMTTSVITVGPDAPVGEIAAILLSRRISALPVLDKGRLIGMVSEADLVHRHAVGENTPVALIAALLDEHGIKRVPVMRGERLVGIVSRANLVQALAAEARAVSRPPRDDAAIHDRVVAELERQSWWRSPYASVTVSEGVVHYWGATETDEDRDAVRIAAENVPGVLGVEDHRIRMADIPSMV